MLVGPIELFPDHQYERPRVCLHPENLHCLNKFDCPARVVQFICDSFFVLMMLCWLFIWSLQSPVLKTQTITISDVTNSLRGSVTYKDIPVVHSETKTITYESAQVRGILSLTLSTIFDALLWKHISWNISLFHEKVLKYSSTTKTSSHTRTYFEIDCLPK